MKKYFIGTGNYNDSDKWVDKFNKPCLIPIILDDVILDDRCVNINIYKHSLWNRIYNVILCLVTLKFKRAYKALTLTVLAKSLTIDTKEGMVVFIDRVYINQKHKEAGTITHIAGTITTSK